MDRRQRAASHPEIADSLNLTEDKGALVMTCKVMHRLQTQA